MSDLLTADGLDDAVIGVASDNSKVVYSADKVIGILKDRDGMTDEEALEYFEYNIAGAYVGPSTPLFVWDMELADAIFLVADMNEIGDDYNGIS
tara:strand:+ start:1786 stop:2067 length:282 start_codon:yes stop_codon:yes gene_type:complete